MHDGPLSRYLDGVSERDVDRAEERRDEERPAEGAGPAPMPGSDVSPVSYTHLTLPTKA